MPTDRELQAAHALAQPLIQSAFQRDLTEALRIARNASMMLPEPRHLSAVVASREYWQQMAMQAAELLVSASACINDPVRQALPAAERLLAQLRDREAQEKQ